MLFPNPAEQPVFYYTSSTKEAQVLVYSLDGRAIGIETLVHEPTRSQVQLPQDLPSGLYFIQIGGQAYKWYYQGN